MSHGHLVFHIDVTNGATVLVSVGSSLEVADLELEELHQAAKIRQHTPDVQRLFDQHGFSLNSLGRELKNALERAAPQGSEAFEKLRRLWRKTKKKLAILEASTPTRAGPRAFVDQVGSNAALVSWEVLEHLTEGFFEVVLLGYQERTERTSVTRSRHLEMLGLAKSHFACRNLHPHEVTAAQSAVGHVCAAAFLFDVNVHRKRTSQQTSEPPALIETVLLQRV
eukprot:g28616.t1